MSTVEHDPSLGETTMSPEAIASDEAFGLPLYDVKKIYPDPKFNCRGSISPLDVIDLAKDISKNGLQQPIVIAPRRNDTPPGFDYMVIAGHRRHKAYMVNKRYLIPAVLREDLDEFKARTLNFVENIKRQDLNLLQEAMGVKPYRDAGWSRQRIAKELDLTEGWVQIRLMVLDLPETLQQAVATGIFTQNQIRELHGIKDPDKQLNIAKKLKEAKQRGDDLKVNALISKERKPNSKKIRKRSEIFLAMEEIMNSLGPGFHTRCLAWAAGQISDLELYHDLKVECGKAGINYQIPSMIPGDIENLEVLK